MALPTIIASIAGLLLSLAAFAETSPGLGPGDQNVYLTFGPITGLDMHCLNEHLAIVNFSVEYEVSNSTEHRAGVLRRSICVVTDRKQIIAIAEHPFVR